MPSKPFIVAELSANHLGSLDRALAIANAAAIAGADALKLQCWTPDTMAMAGEWKGRRLKDLYREAFLPWDWFPDLIGRCKELGIECFSSVFDAGALEFLEALGCQRYKIASFELVDTPLIRAVAETGKPVILSTGMATWDEIVLAIDALGELPIDVCVTLLKCTSAYPATAEDANLAAIVDMRERLFSLGSPDVGLSDHTPGIGVAVAATALGVSMVEKHLTLCRADGGPDAVHSLEPEEFKRLVTECRRAAEALGEVRYGPTEAEKETVKLRRSLWVVKDILPGEVLTREHVASMRPAYGLPPKDLDKILGMQATLEIPAGTPLGWEMLV